MKWENYRVGDYLDDSCEQGRGNFLVQEWHLPEVSKFLLKRVEQWVGLGGVGFCPAAT